MQCRLWVARRAERRAAHTGDGFQNGRKLFSLGPHDASSAPWSSPPSLTALYQLGKGAVTLCSLCALKLANRAP